MRKTESPQEDSPFIRSLKHLEQKPRWNCEDCGEIYLGQPDARRLCTACSAAAEERWIRGLPKGEALVRSRVPQGLRHDHDWLSEPWPHDPRRRASEIDPLQWPELVARSSGSPSMVVFTGSNGSGKSTRSAHLLYLLHRQGIRPLYWVSEMELAEERESFGPRPLFATAKRAGAVVIDELGSTRGRKSDVELALNVALQVIDKRLNLAKPTICTSHRPLSREGAKKRGQPESESLEAIAPAIYDRLRTGLILGLPNRSYRGLWATEVRS